MEWGLWLPGSFWHFRVPGRDSLNFLWTSSAESSEGSWHSFLCVAESLKELIQLQVGEQLRQGPRMWVPTQLTHELLRYLWDTSPGVGPDLSWTWNCFTHISATSQRLCFSSYESASYSSHRIFPSPHSSLFLPTHPCLFLCTPI